VNTAIEIHDSQVSEIIDLDGAVIVHIQPAYLHKSEGRPGFDSGTGWVQEARLIFTRATTNGDFPDWPCRIMGGELVLDGEIHRNLIPVPLEASGDSELRLVCDSVHTVTIRGRGAKLELIGEPKFIEEFRP
jgi:hypothetical protein